MPLEHVLRDLSPLSSLEEAEADKELHIVEGLGPDVAALLAWIDLVEMVPTLERGAVREIVCYLEPAFVAVPG